jgi:protein gp37
VTAIEWTDATWNPVTGCTKVSLGCAHCYAERITERFGRQKFTDVVLHPERLDIPLRWKKPRRVFVNSMSDLFHEDAPDEFIGKVWEVMEEASAHTFQILTKRAGRMHMWVDEKAHAYLPNVWLGVSVEDQERADERIPLLVDTPAAVRFVSCEPMLGPVDIRESLTVDWRGNNQEAPDGLPALDWVIVGGESGPGARPMQPEWARSIRDQCVAAGVPFFFKQWGGRTPKAGGRELDGRTWEEYPR